MRESPSNRNDYNQNNRYAAATTDVSMNGSMRYEDDNYRMSTMMSTSSP